MLYVSRYIAKGAYIDYGLVDSETGIERTVNSGKLFDIARQFNVKGVNAKDWGVSVYQPEDTVTGLQAKTYVMKHVSVKIYKNMIASIKWDEDAITKPVTIRLSDFAMKCADYCIRENHFSTDDFKCILVFDDGVEFNRSMFDINLAVFSAVVFDYRGLSDKWAAHAYSCMYQSLYQSSIFLVSKRRPFVLDIEGRVFKLGLSVEQMTFIQKGFDIVGDLHGKH